MAKTNRFTGKFKSAFIVEGSGDLTFIGMNGQEIRFAYDMTWGHKLPYHFFDDLANSNLNHVGKWFMITYKEVYGNLVGDDTEDQRWYKKIESIKMMTIPKSKSRQSAELCTIKDIHVQSSTIEFLDKNGQSIFTIFEVSSLKNLSVDFIKQVVDGEHGNTKFKIRYQIEYELESSSAVSNKLTSIKRSKSH
ncbi:MAG: hypothetical protein O9262_13515 [Cyclobacteriaceae bacterium]|nr:hypothetical protein [Cyclobacteriaceae bacterium]